MHEAIAQFPSEQVPPGTVIEVTLPGYRLHDRVVRPSQVLVSSRPAGNAEG
jgi:molecular chaperone GrpE